MLVVMVPAFLALDRKPRPPAFFLIAFPLLYAPVRFFWISCASAM